MTDAATDGKETKSKELQLANLCWGKCEEAFAEEEDVDHEAASAEVKSHFGSVLCLPGPVVHRPKPSKAKEEQVQCCAGTVHHVVLLSHFCSVGNSANAKTLQCSPAICVAHFAHEGAAEHLGVQLHVPTGATGEGSVRFTVSDDGTQLKLQPWLPDVTPNYKKWDNLGEVTCDSEPLVQSFLGLHANELAEFFANF